MLQVFVVTQLGYDSMKSYGGYSLSRYLRPGFVRYTDVAIAVSNMRGQDEDIVDFATCEVELEGYVAG